MVLSNKRILLWVVHYLWIETDTKVDSILDVDTHAHCSPRCFWIWTNKTPVSFVMEESWEIVGYDLRCACLILRVHDPAQAA